MPKPYTLKWQTIEDGEYDRPVVYPEYLKNEPACPKCGYETVYWEGEIDQDTMGNSIYGFNYYCPECHISCEAEELDDSDD